MLKSLLVKRRSVSKFQSPCAGNMFGKECALGADEARLAKFQSPCAGNMFGKNTKHKEF